MSSSSLSGAVKVILQSSDSKIFEINKAVTKQSVTIEYLIEDRLTNSDPVVIPNVSGNTLTKIIVHCERVIAQPPSDENDLELKAFVSGLRLLSLTCKEVLDWIKHKYLAHICMLFNITPKFSPEDEERLRSANPLSFNLLVKTHLLFLIQSKI
ncbi:hypothetical protein M9H77_16516 [Catharanthus roseus]|uniref:Uncharacterized protein n=1 Tax=Catharanthus roseus TaxID=4058 RepID=A0ACC0B1Z8_CATRO|nr:hypothetical protein M9H77_16516 [Catharanthus roseus]